VAESSEAIPPDPRPGFARQVVGLLFSPLATFEALLPKARPGPPFLAFMALTLGFFAVWFPRVDPVEFMKSQDEQTKRFQGLTADQQAEVIHRQVEVFRRLAWLQPLLAAPVLVGVVGAFLLFVYRFFYASEMNFVQALTITSYSFLVVSLVQTPLLLVTLSLKGDWNLRPDEAFATNLSLLLDKKTASGPVYSLATSFDLFSFWTMALLAGGFGVASRRRMGSAVWGIIIPWALLVAIKVALSALS
jgi:hypothetical protein